jgi:thiamine transport system substrate-binding protein
MRRTFSLLFFTVLVWVGSTLHLTAAGISGDSNEPALRVYCYDSFSSEWGPGQAIAEAFYESSGIRLEFNAPGDAVTVLNQLILEKNTPGADVVVGLDNSLLNRALEAGVLEAYESPGLKDVLTSAKFDPSHHLLPFDFGHFAVCYDTRVIKNPPESLEDLTSSRYEKSLVLMDPRTSTPGLGFLMWTRAVYGERWPDYWKRLRPSILTVSDGWSQGYTLFASGEAPMVLSYGTSPVYHQEYEKTDHFKAAEFSDGHPVQIEGMGIVRGTEFRKESEAFIDFMLGPVAQGILAVGNIMLPVKSDTVLPESFSAALNPEKTIVFPAQYSKPDEIEEMIRLWREVFGS